jgi:hypothetical protein
VLSAFKAIRNQVFAVSIKLTHSLTNMY